MKFGRTIFPVITGVENIRKAMNKIEIDENFQISAVKTGIPCIIYNGSIRKANGEPFKNSHFQNEFIGLIRRSLMMKSIFVGTVYMQSASKRPTYRDRYELTEISELLDSASRTMSSIMNDVHIELIDLLIIKAEELKLDIRSKMIENICKSGDQLRISAPIEYDFKDKDKDNLIKFIVDSSKEKREVLIRPSKSIYINGRVDLIANKSFIADAFELFNGSVESIRKSTTQDYTNNNKNVEVIDFLRVVVKTSVGELKASVPMIKTPLQTNKYVLKMINSGKLKNVVFRALMEKPKGGLNLLTFPSYLC